MRFMPQICPHCKNPTFAGFCRLSNGELRCINCRSDRKMEEEKIIKCVCGVELCNRDVINWEGTLASFKLNRWSYSQKKYRCPKCFKTKVINFDPPLIGKLIEVQ